MKVIASAAVSLDGYMDDLSAERLVLSSAEDWAEVYALRASCDAILAGAGTLRRDNPSLLAKGHGSSPLRVTLSRRGNLDASLRFFTGPGRPVVFTETGGGRALEGVAETVEAERITPALIIAELERRGIERLMVEGGVQVLRMFLEAGAVDEMRMAVAPLFVDQPGAPRLCGTGRMILQKSWQAGQMTVMQLIPEDARYMSEAIAESMKCTPSAGSYSVGAVIVAASGKVYRGFTHETSPAGHAEEEAIAKALAEGEELKGATIYSSMEPCSVRRSKPESCSQLIIGYGFRRAVFALHEPSCFADCKGEEMLRDAGVEVLVMAHRGGEVLRINGHLCK